MMVEVPYDEKNVFRSRDRTAPDTAIGIYPGVGRYAIDSWRIFVAGGGASVGLQGEKPVSPFDTAHRMAVSVTDSKSTASPVILLTELCSFIEGAGMEVGHAIGQGASCISHLALGKGRLRV